MKKETYRTVKLAVFLLIVLSLSIILIIKGEELRYFVSGNIYKHLPNCYDNIKNQDEKDVDCGGVCPNCKVKLNNEIFSEKAEAVKIGDNQYLLITNIYNLNPIVGSDSFKYSFSLYDYNNNVFRKIDGYGFIYPSEEKYIIDNVSNISEKILEVKFDMSDFDLKDFSYNAPKYNIDFSDSKFKFNSDKTAEFSAIARNKSKDDLGNIDVVILARDKNNKIILAKSANIGALPHNDISFIKVVWYGVYDMSNQIEIVSAKFYIKPID